MPDPMTEQELTVRDLHAEYCNEIRSAEMPGIYNRPKSFEQFMLERIKSEIAEVRRLREELGSAWNENMKLSAKQHFLEAINSELQAVNSKLRELHADALRQIKLVQEKADQEIARLSVHGL